MLSLNSSRSKQNCIRLSFFTEHSKRIKQIKLEKVAFTKQQSVTIKDKGTMSFVWPSFVGPLVPQIDINTDHSNASTVTPTINSFPNHSKDVYVKCSRLSHRRIVHLKSWKFKFESTAWFKVWSSSERSRSSIAKSTFRYMYFSCFGFFYDYPRAVEQFPNNHVVQCPKRVMVSSTWNKNNSGY